MTYINGTEWMSLLGLTRLESIECLVESTKTRSTTTAAQKIPCEWISSVVKLAHAG